MPGSLVSEESLRAPSSLSFHHSASFSTAASSSRATSPLPVYNQKPDPQRTISPSHSRATSPTPRSKRRPSISRHHSTNTSFSPPRMDGLLSRVLAEEDKYITRLRDQITELSSELKVRTEALEQAYERVQTADKRTVETHKKYLAEASARAAAESECKKVQEENRKAHVMVGVLRDELDRARDDVERLEAERAEAESAAGRARAVARELKQSMKVGRAREGAVPETRGPDDRSREREKEEVMAAAVREAYEKGKAEGEASATMKALAAFDKLMENDELNEWDDQAKKSTREEIKGMSRKPSADVRASAERAKSPQPSPPKRKWSIRRGSSSNGN
ncbi:hypothetical protein RSOL_473080 [Rhizoctonia solani AG-3 Rhs1AP]|uniref:Uncharacterized protein n=1 Tax=Rhizoctonia solani AG-3 Rhs1AP TaxID=1086054 RepID=X8JSR5_9AGAM|nr:hypothetical protein RSOL_473080 [Rhizoctonia solani AG-3 Rhs1AP]